MIWTIILWIIIGFIVGWLAKLISPNKISTGFWGTTLLGIVGSVVGGWLGSLINVGDGAAPDNFNFWSIIIAIVGGIVVLWILSLFGKTRKK